MKQIYNKKITKNIRDIVIINNDYYQSLYYINNNSDTTIFLFHGLGLNGLNYYYACNDKLQFNNKFNIYSFNLPNNGKTSGIHGDLDINLIPKMIKVINKLIRNIHKKDKKHKIIILSESYGSCLLLYGMNSNLLNSNNNIYYLFISPAVNLRRVTYFTYILSSLLCFLGFGSILLGDVTDMYIDKSDPKYLQYKFKYGAYKPYFDINFYRLFKKITLNVSKQKYNNDKYKNTIVFLSNYDQQVDISNVKSYFNNANYVMIPTSTHAIIFNRFSNVNPIVKHLDYIYNK